MQSGLIKKWMKRHWPMEGNKCDKSRSKLGHTKPSLSDTFGAFFTLGVGITASILVFVLEVIVYTSRDTLHKVSKRKKESSNGSIWEANPFRKFRAIYSLDNLFANKAG